MTCLRHSKTQLQDEHFGLGCVESVWVDWTDASPAIVTREGPGTAILDAHKNTARGLTASGSLDRS